MRISAQRFSLSAASALAVVALTTPFVAQAAQAADATPAAQAAQAAHAAPRGSSGFLGARTIDDARHDQHHGRGWSDHLLGRAEADLLRSRVAVRNDTVVVTTTLADLRPDNGTVALSLASSGQNVSRSGTLDVDLATDVSPKGWADTELYLSRSPACGHRVRTVLRPQAHQVIVRFPASCLPGGTLTGWRTDSSTMLSDYTVVATDLLLGSWHQPTR